MKFVHDVWVNWSYGGDKKKLIPEYFEWRKDDNIELFSMFPIVRVSQEDYERILFGYEELPQTFLDKLENKATAGNGRNKEESNYSVIISDGENALAISTEQYKEPALKSKLIPRQETRVRRLLRDIPLTSLEWEHPKEEIKYRDGILGAIIEIRPEYMVGLTRRERELKEILFNCLFEVSCSDNIQEIRYWFIELFPDMYGTEALENLQREDLLNLMFKKVRYGWTDTHMQFGNNLVKVYGLFEDMWNDIKNYDGNRRRRRTGNNRR